MDEARCVHVMIEGRVQGVGYRAWTAQQARERGLWGWVRNRHDGRVEAVFAGAAGAVDAMIAACGDGPPKANVSAVDVVEGGEPPATGFQVLPTA